MTIWDAYPPHLPPASLHQGKAFWGTTNLYDLYIPVEDLNDGWRRNGSVGQELYGAGAAFNIATEAYTRLPEAGLLLFCEYPLLKAAWDSKQRTLTAHVGGVAQHEAKLEVRFDRARSGWQRPGDLKATCAPEGRPEAAQPLTVTIAGEALRMAVPGESIVRIAGPTPG
jgi:hypothetical protein